MITQTGPRSCRRGRERLLRVAAGAMILSAAGCAEIEVGAEAYKTLAQTNQPPPAQPAAPDPARVDLIDPSMRADPEAFHAADLALWDGARTLPGIWVAHPMAETARRVRLTNTETGARVDAAMFRRDPNLSGPRIVISSEAAERLGLTPGRATSLTIDGLAYRTDAESVVAGAAPAEVPAEQEAPPVAALNGARLAAPSPPAQEEVQSIADAPQQGAGPGAPAPDGAGDITDGRHFIEAGVFGQPTNAARLAERLRAADLPATELPLTVGERQLTRVLVGPYRTVAERDSALEAVRKLGPADATPARG
ncbi:MAG: SPOR domain-containing protein [Paracoccaceae bacterium]